MDGLEKILPTLPSWISIPIILASLLLSVGPKLIELFAKADSRSRAFKRERERLDLLKLRYEIEAFRKEKGIESVSDPLFAEQLPEASREIRESAVPESKPLLRSQRFLYGALGAAIPSVIRLVFLLLQSHDYPMSISVGYYLAIAFLACLGGLASSFIPRRQVDPFVCFLIGFAITLLLTSIGQSTQKVPPPTKAPSGAVGSFSLTYEARNA